MWALDLMIDRKYVKGAAVCVVTMTIHNTAVLGLLLGGYIKEYLFNPTVVTVMWALGGLVILLYVRAREKQGKGFEGKKLEELSYSGAE
jgi:undecaprenyl pyrophosphate phosphatase UppP